jgi:hypothetical protein
MRGSRRIGTRDRGEEKRRSSTRGPPVSGFDGWTPLFALGAEELTSFRTSDTRKCCMGFESRAVHVPLY